MREETVHRIREFNRFYMPAMELLGNHYLGSEYSASDARILYEVYVTGVCNAAYIANSMKIDKSYLSRIIKSHEKNGYLVRTQSKKDSRCFDIRLTEKGIERTEDFIDKSNQFIGGLIASLDEEKCQELTEAFDTITRILSECGENKSR